MQRQWDEPGTGNRRERIRRKSAVVCRAPFYWESPLSPSPTWFLQELPFGGGEGRPTDFSRNSGTETKESLARDAGACPRSSAVELPGALSC